MIEILHAMSRLRSGPLDGDRGLWRRWSPPGTGDGRGREAAGEGSDGTLAQLTYLETGNVEDALDPKTKELFSKRQALVDAIDRLRIDRANLPVEKYEAELERLLLELAVVDRELRATP